jgi:transposase
MNTTTIGLDIAKSYFQVHGVDAYGRPTLQRQLRRAQLLMFFANLPPCLVGIEACASAHHWARKLSEFGHQVKLMPPQFVKAYVKTNKNDARDAEAICEAVARPNMRFVAVKTVAQQELLMLHRVRQRLVVERTAKVNQLRGLLAEFGIVMPQGLHSLERLMPEILGDAENGLTCRLRERFCQLFSHMRELSATVKEWERQIVSWHRENPLSRRLEKIPGIGPLSASALVASIGDVRTFKSGRQLAAWLGLVPRQESSGGKTRLLGISKRGDRYLRTLLILGARSVLRQMKRDAAAVPRSWLGRLSARRHVHIAAVALANKNARIAWALLAHEREYRANYQSNRPVMAVS